VHCVRRTEKEHGNERHPGWENSCIGLGEHTPGPLCGDGHEILGRLEHKVQLIGHHRIRKNAACIANDPLGKNFRKRLEIELLVEINRTSIALIQGMVDRTLRIARLGRGIPKSESLSEPVDRFFLVQIEAPGNLVYRWRDKPSSEDSGQSKDSVNYRYHFILS